MPSSFCEICSKKIKTFWIAFDYFFLLDWLCLWEKGGTYVDEYISDSKIFEKVSSCVICDHGNRQVEYTVIISCVPNQWIKDQQKILFREDDTSLGLESAFLFEVIVPIRTAPLVGRCLRESFKVTMNDKWIFIV